MSHRHRLVNPRARRNAERIADAWDRTNDYSFSYLYWNEVVDRRVGNGYDTRPVFNRLVTAKPVAFPADTHEGRAWAIARARLLAEELE